MMKWCNNSHIATAFKSLISLDSIVIYAVLETLFCFISLFSDWKVKHLTNCISSIFWSGRINCIHLFHINPTGRHSKYLLELNQIILADIEHLMIIKSRKRDATNIMTLNCFNDTLYNFTIQPSPALLGLRSRIILFPYPL